MITWITETIGTGAYDEVSKIPRGKTTQIIDVRDLVDKQGNNVSAIKNKIEESLSALRKNTKIVICCDYGISRSNTIAIGVLVRWLTISFEEAISRMQQTIDMRGINIEVLNTVHHALYDSPRSQHISSVSKNILITGGNGFIGTRLQDTLKKKYKITSPTSKELNVLKDPTQLYQIAVSKKIDTIIHLANPRILTANTSMGDTLVMLKNVLDICRINHIKLIFLSSWEVYSGYTDTQIAANEHTPLNPKGSYGETKWLCELLIKQHAAKYNIHHQIIRLSPVYGPGGERPKFIYTFIRKALRNEEITTHQYNNGHPTLDLLYIDDAVAAITKAVASTFEGELNIGSGKGTSTYDIATLICKLTASQSNIKHATIQEQTAHVTMDTTRAHELLEWKPIHALEFGLNKLITTVQL